jgi:hypothetical protein
MIKFTAKGLVSLFVTGLALLLTPIKSDAQVNMKTLVQVAKSCQKEASSIKYYQKMGIVVDINTNNYIQKEKNQLIEKCIFSRYHYSLVVSKFPWLNSSGQIMAGYPGSVIVASLVLRLEGGKTPIYVLNCLYNQNASSQQCSQIKNFMGYDQELRCSYPDRCTTLRNQLILNLYEVHVCPSCVVAHNEASGSQIEILTVFIKWFTKLDKQKARELSSILDDDNKADNLRNLIKNESELAKNKYRQTRKRVEMQEQERRR